MHWIRLFWLRVRNIVDPSHLDRDVAEQVDTHREMIEADLIERGMAPDLAASEARRAVGNQGLIRELAREQVVPRFLGETLRDIRYGIRNLGRNPGFAAVAALTLALGVGAVTAVFTVVNAVLLRPLPYADADRLVEIVENVPAEESFNGAAFRRSSMNQDEFGWWRDQTQTLEMAVTMPESRTLSTSEGTVRLRGARVSPILFSMRGIKPILGRGLNPTEERPDAGVIALNEETWQRYFESRPDVIGETIVLDRQPYSIVGVMPAEFGDAEFWLPFVIEPPRPGQSTVIRVTARLRESAPLAQATAEANVLGLRYRGMPSEPESPPRFEVVRSLDRMVGPVRPALRVLTVAVGVVLLIVCANLANLLLSRSAYRRDEVTVRQALGASRLRIARQMLTESLVLSTCGCLAGIVFAYGAVRVLRLLAIIDVPARFQNALGPGGTAILPRLDEITLDMNVLGFAVGTSLVSGLLFGVAPAILMSARLRPNTLGGRFTEFGGKTGNGVGTTLAVSQIAMATTLLVAAGLLIHSFAKLSAVDTGFEPQQALNFQLVLPGDYRPTEKFSVANELANRVAALPRVEAAGFTDAPPLAGELLLAPFVPPGVTDAAWNSGPFRDRPQSRRVSPGYLRAIGARLADGRWIEEADGPPRRPTVLVSQAYARRFFGDRTPVGSVLRAGSDTVEIIGVVDDVRFGGLLEEPEAVVFVDPRHELMLMPNDGSTPMADQVFLTAMTGMISFAVRVDGDPRSIGGDVRALLSQIDPDAAIEGVAPMADVLSDTIARPRFYAIVVGVFGGVAVVLAAVGIYGVLAYAVSRRTREIGIRMALGATRSAVVFMILRHGAVMAAIGIPAGMLGAAWVSQSLESMLFGLTTSDTTTYAAIAVLFGIVVIGASYIPARRAAAVDPLVAIRHE